MATEEERFLLVVFAVTGSTLNAVFVRRGTHTFKGALALPGGFVYRMKTL